MELEARLLRAAAGVGVPVPTVRAAGAADPTRLGTSFMIMDRIQGETIARRILRDPQFEQARHGLARQCGEALAKLHGVDGSTIVGLETIDPVDRYRLIYDQLGHRVETFELAFDWLKSNRPESRPSVVVHGDFRMGNLIVRPDGLASVLDWELAHLGDPMEDLAWLSIRAWRFGGDHPVAGVGSFDDLFDGYRSAGGVIDMRAFEWWLVAGTLMWGVMCIMQANAHLSGAVQSVELAAIGRRVVEQEHDLLMLLDPEGLGAAKARFAATRSDEATIVQHDEFGLPSAQVLVDAVRQFLENDVMSNTTGRVQFHARVSANVLAIVSRQLGAMSRVPAEVDPEAPSEQVTLSDRVIARLAVSNPKYGEISG
jgi:aminoglycoside phosphotransferase (APT) family kinase protein